MLIDWLQDERVTRRVAAGLMVGLVCMYGAWTAGFFFLPEGALRGKTGAGAISALLPENASVFLLALVWNGAMAFVVMPLVCLLAVRRLSLGYILAWGNFALFGIFLGTNSFGNPRPEPLAPRLEVFTGTGVWEISAYVLVAAALANRYRFRQRGWLSSATTRISRAGSRLTNGQRATLIVAAVLIVMTAWVEHRRATAHRESSAIGMRANSAVARNLPRLQGIPGRHPSPDRRCA